MISIGRLHPRLPELEARLREWVALARRDARLAARGAAWFAGSVHHQLESGRSSRARPRELRDEHGRRLRASAYGHGLRARHGRGAGGPPSPTGWVPAAAKVLLVLLVAGAAFLGSSQAYINFAADLPDAHAIASEPVPEDTLIYANDSTTLLADIHPSGLQHYYEPLSAMGKWLPAATVAIEDSNFYNEPGIDVGAMARAAVVDWREHRTAQGASTITQQLVKLRLLDSSQTIERKIKEAVLAIQVEHSYSKQQILEMYLNTVSYGNNSQGSLAASRIYFHEETKDLTLGQAAMLAGLPQSPLYNSPFTNWDAAKARQLDVLNAMVRTRQITRDEADKAYAEDLKPPQHMFTAGPQVLRAPGFAYYVIDQLKQRYGEKTAYGGGLRVVTTLNWHLQQIAEQAIVHQVDDQRWRHVSQGALVSIDPHTGAVVAMVGAADPSQNGGQYNMAVWPPRNPGSSMKIYNYTAAIESTKFTMVTPIVDSPLRIKQPGATDVYEPKNYDLQYHGTCQLQQCMGNSLNVPAVKVELGVGVPAVVDVARRMGAPPWLPHPDGHYTSDDPPDAFGFSLTLGGYGETPLQMATGASVLAAQGVLHQPFSILQVTTSDGGEVFKADWGSNAKQVLDSRVAWIMETIMSDDDNRAMIFGRGSPLTLPGRKVAAKTGTTDDFGDAWTVGYTPDLATAVWMGNPNFSKMVQGSDGVFVAAPAWHNFMQGALDALGKGNVWFSEPQGLGEAIVAGKPAYFLPGTSPSTQAPPLPSWAQTSGAPSGGERKPTRG